MPHTIEIPEKKIKVNFPSSWEELTDEQFHFIMQLYIDIFNKDPFSFRIIVAYYLLGLYPKTIFEKGKLHAQMSEDKKTLTLQERENKHGNLFLIAENLLKWMFDKKTNQFKVTSLRNFLTKLDNGFYGPTDALTDCTCDEYFQAFDYYRNYVANKNSFDLNMLIACLYWPKRENLEKIKNTPNFDGRNRNEFNTNLVIKHAEMLQDIPIWQKHAIFQYFGNADMNLKRGTIAMNGIEVSFAPIFKNKQDDGKETKDAPSSNILLSISESKVFGDMEKVEKQNIYTIFYYLLKKKEEADELKTNSKK